MNNFIVIFEGHYNDRLVGFGELSKLLGVEYDANDKEQMKELYHTHGLIYECGYESGWYTKKRKQVVVNWQHVIFTSCRDNRTCSEIYLNNGYVLKVLTKALKEALMRIEELLREDRSQQGYSRSPIIKVDVMQWLYIQEPSMNVKTDL